MRGLWLEDGKLTLRDDLPRPDPPPGEALIRVGIAGICATDLELVRGYYPYAGIPGHELLGQVTAAPGAPEWVGQRVVGEINAACGACAACRAGRERHCPNRTVLGIVNRHGCLAEYTTLPLANLLPVPDHLSGETALFCEPLAAALEIVEQVHLRGTDRALVVGAGRLGQLIARCLVLRGGEVWAVARHQRQDLALRGAGATPLDEDEVKPGAFDVVVEASGSPQGFALARRALRPRGTLVLKSTYAGRLELDASSLVVDEITVVGSRCGPFAPALRLLARGLVDPRPLIEASYSLSEGLAAFERAARPGALKVMIRG